MDDSAAATYDESFAQTVRCDRLIMDPIHKYSASSSPGLSQAATV